MKSADRLKSADVEIREDYIVVNSTYKITSDGQVFNVKSGKKVKITIDAKGYGVVYLGKDIKLVKIHRVIAQYFVDNPHGHPLVGHKDGNKSNWNAENLDWFSKMTEDLTGRKFERLKVTGFSRDTLTNKGFIKLLWSCMCDCGNETLVQTSDLTSGHTKSCGCLNSNVTAERNLVHGLRKAPEYQVWQNMKERCYNQSNKYFENYGGRGIILEGTWQVSFSDFYNDMGPRPSNKHTIERVDVNGNYCKENCIWTDDYCLQAFNQRLRKTNTSGRTGVHFSEGKWNVRIKGKNIFRTDDFELACFVREEAELTHYGFIKE